NFLSYLHFARTQACLSLGPHSLRARKKEKSTRILRVPTAITFRAWSRERLIVATSVERPPSSVPHPRSPPPCVRWNRSGRHRLPVSRVRPDGSGPLNPARLSRAKGREG